MFAQFRMAWPLNWNALLQSRGDINTGVDLSVTEVLPQFTTGATHSRSGESLSASLRLRLLGLDVSRWLGTALATTIARRDQAPYLVPRCQRRARSDIFAFGIALAVAMTATAAPAAASYRIGYWGPHVWAPHKRVAHNPKTAERASKEPVVDVPKGPLQIFISINQQKMHGYIRMPRDFAVRLYRLTRLGTRFIISNSELKPVEFADPHLFVHKEKPPEVATAPQTGVETAAAKPAELAVHANMP